VQGVASLPRPVVHLADTALSADGNLLAGAVAAIQQELDVSPDFPPEVEAAAEAAADAPRLPELDRTSVALVTIDPASSMDLDQALHIERAGDGYTVYYAIADVAAFVAAGDPVDVEAHRRGETLYGASSKVPLHPKVLSEGATSLLPGEVRPALLWTIGVGSSGDCTGVHVERARVASTAKLDYSGVQQRLDSHTSEPVFDLLHEVGELRIRREAERGGVSLPLPEQEVRVEGEDWTLDYRAPLPVEQWNAQISLLTGMAAASLMVGAKVGVLRTLPPAQQRDLDRLRRTAKALRIRWPGRMGYPDFVRTLDAAQPRHAAMLLACTRVLRGSGYVGFDGALPGQPMHSALAAEYAHCTAPLRRLVDRYAGEVCVAVCAREPVPQWVTEQLDVVPDVMRESGHRASQYERAILDLTEAAVLQRHVGEVFDGTVVTVDDRNPRHGSVMLQEPAVEAPVEGPSGLPLGEDVRVRLVAADVPTRSVRFEIA
jgi:exoribonuclease R